MTLQKRVLFVDDDPAILSGLQNLLYKDRKRWEMVFAPGVDRALQEFQKQPFDVVVTDMRMPGRDGASLLSEIKSRYPATARIMLSGQADADAIYRALPALHQLLAKPCDAVTLRGAIERGLDLSTQTRAGDLNALIGQIDQLPSAPQAHADLMSVFDASAPRIEDALAIVQRDPSLAMKLLQVANSAYFGSGPTSSIRSAVALLGLDRIRHVASTMTLFLIEGPASGRAEAAAIRASRLVPERAEEAYTAGLLHDVGSLVHLVRGDAVEDPDAGACLLGLWGLPASLVEVVRHHRAPDLAPPDHRLLAAAVHVAAAMAHERPIDRAAVERAGCVRLLEACHAD